MNLPYLSGDVKNKKTCLTAWLGRVTLVIGLERKETNLKDKNFDETEK